MNTDKVNRNVIHYALDFSGKVWCGTVFVRNATLDPQIVTCMDCRRRALI